MGEPSNADIPTISITHDETSEDQEQLPIPKAIYTDIEDIDSDDEIKITKSDVLEGNYLSLAKEDEGVTDNEMFEDSADDDDVENHPRPPTPLPPDDIFDYGETIDECVRGLQDEKPIDAKFRKEISEKRTFLGLEKYDHGVTDVEDFATSGDEEDEECEKGDEIDISDLIEGEIVGITDQIKNTTEGASHESSSDLSDYPSPKKENRKSTKKKSSSKSLFLAPRSASPRLGNLTDVEIMLSESEDDENTAKNFRVSTRNKNTNLIVSLVITGGTTDVEELSGNEELRSPQRKPKKLVKKVKDGSQKPKNVRTSQRRRAKINKKEEEVDERLNTSPTSQLIDAMATAGLKVEALETAGVTDVEDFEDVEGPDDRDREKNSSPENEELVKPLRDMEEFYSSISESIKHAAGNKAASEISKKINKNVPTIVIKHESSDQTDTDSDTERKIVLKNLNKRKGTPKPTTSNLLQMEDASETALTEAEVLDSSDNENPKQDQLYLKFDDAAVTDIEDFSDDDEIENHRVRQKNDIEPELPKPYRKMILISEKQDGNPVAKILPLDESYLTANNDHENNMPTTDVEDYAASELSDNEPRPPSPELATTEPCTIQETEIIKTEKKKKLKPPGRNIFESVTDSEDVFLDDENEKRKRKGKNKNNSKLKSEENLRVENTSIRGGTDVEELSDGDGIQIPTSNSRPEGGLNINTDEHITDVESIAFTSNGESDEGYQASSAASEAEQEFSLDGDVSGETVICGYGERETIKHYVNLPAPVKLQDTHTDVDEISGTTDDDDDNDNDNSASCELEPSSSTVYIKSSRRADYDAPEEVIHLKTYTDMRESHTDVEDITTEDRRNFDEDQEGSWGNRSGEMSIFTELLNEVIDGETFTFETSGSEFKNNFNRHTVFEYNIDTSDTHDESCVCVGENAIEISLFNDGWEESTIYFSEDDDCEEYSEKGQSEEYVRETQGIRSDQVTEPIVTAPLENETEVKSEEPQQAQSSPEKPGDIRFEELDTSGEYPKESESTGFVTTPTSKRRVQSQRISRDKCPSVTPYQGEFVEIYSSDEEEDKYTVDEPGDALDDQELGRIHSSPDIYGPVFTHKRKESSIVETPLDEEEPPGEGEAPEEPEKNGSVAKSPAQPKSQEPDTDASKSEGKTDLKESSITESIEKSEKTFEGDGADVISEASQSIISNTETLLDAPRTGVITDSGISTASKDISDITETDEAKKPEVKEEPDESEQSESDGKHRVIFHIESEEDLQSDIESDQVPIPIDSSSSTEEFIEKVKQDLKTTLEKEQLILEEKLAQRSRIFDDLSDESLTKTKELVDERLRKISESKTPKEQEESIVMTKKEKSPVKSETVEEITIGRFHVTPAQVTDPLIDEDKEKLIADRLKTDREAEEDKEEIEKELPEKLTEEDFEEVMRELKMEGLETDVYLEKDPEDKEEKKEKTLRRVERRFERMASETLDKDKEEENVSEEKLNEKREVEFQRMISQLSTEEVAECQQEYLQLWEEGGLSSLTPTDDWESRDPDTPDNELEEDSPRKPESYRGSHGQGKHEESIKYPDTKKSSKTPDVSTNIQTSPLESVNISDDISPVTQNLGIVDPLKVGSSPSEIQQSSDFSDEVQSYGDRKKFWEQMSSSHSSDTGSEHRRSFHESVSRDSFEIDKRSLTSEKEPESSIEEEYISVKSARQKFEQQEKATKSLDTAEKRKSTEEGGLVKSLTESFSEKIFAGELVMPAAPRPKSGSYRDVIEGEEGATTPEAPYLKKQIVEGSSGIEEVSELEAELARRRAGAPITGETVVSGSTGLREDEKDGVEFSIGTTVITKDKTEGRRLTQGASTDSEAEFISKYGEESVAFDNSAFLEDDDDQNIPLSERKKAFEENLNKRPPPVVPIRTSLYERSMSLPPQDLPEIPGIRDKKRYFENQLQKEIVVEQLMTQQDEECSTEIKSIADCQKPWKPDAHKKDPKDDESRKSWKDEADKEKERTQSLIQEKRKSIEVKETAVKVVNELIKEGAKAVEEKLTEKEQDILIPQESELSSTAEEVIHYKSDNLSKPSDSLEVHVDKSEIEENEKEKDVDEVLSAMDKREDDGVPSITVTHSGKRQTETSSIGESEDTQSESDVTPEDARVVDNGAVPWESGGNSPKDDLDMGQTGMGRWVGQEDLSKDTWEKDDIDSRCYQIEPKWERTRSEGASPKEQFVYTPEEHYPDTVWEVPVQEQLETEEITQDIPIEKQVIIEKDEEEEEEEELEEVRDIRDTELTEEEAREIAEEILDYIQFEVENRSSLLITDLSDDPDKHPSDVPHPQVSDYLRQLAGEKNLDDREVELIESVLVQKHREQILKLRNNETTSSQEITDEDLRSSGVETDLSPLDSQAGKLQILGEEEIDSMETSEGIIESRLEELDEKSIKEEMEDFGAKEEEKVEKKMKDADIVEQTIAEVKESLEAAQEELIEQHKKRKKEEIFKKESPSEFEFKGISYEKSIDDKIEERYYEEMEGRTEYETTEQGGKIAGRTDIKAKDQVEFQESDKTRIAKQELFTDSGKKELKSEDISQSQKLTHDLAVSESTIEDSGKEFIQKKLSAEYSDEDDRHTQSKKVSSHIYDEERGIDISKKSEDFASTRSAQSKEKHEDIIFKKVGDGETKVIITKTEDSFTSEASKEQQTYEKLSELEITPESLLSKKFDVQRTSMEDSPKSVSQEESMKSPLGAEEYHSSSSSIGKHDDLLKSDKSGIVMRHSSSSGTGGLPKADRRSGTDLEPYSSSGESHYHSLDQSRPCSSDVEALLAGGVGTTGSSEYESALSQELSSRHTTSGEYVTAVSSLSSRESIKSLDSESSGHLASIEVSSEASETLIASAMELDRDFESSGAILLDDDSPEMMGGRQVGRPPPYVTQMSAPATAMRGSVDEDFEIISESEVASWTGEVSEDDLTEAVAAGNEEEAEDGERHSKLKRSHEMTFQPEPRPIVSTGSLETSPGDIIIEKNIYGSSLDETASMISMQDEKFGSSLEETGSVLSMSLSTASEASAVRTVIELSRTDSEKMDGSLTVSVASADSGSREELDNLTSSTVQPQTNEMSTSTPTSSSGRKTASVTITTSAVDDHGISSVSTQVTSVSRKSSMADDQKSEDDSSHANGPTQVDYVPEYDEVDTTKSKKTHGHRRKESTSNFVPTMQWTVGETKSKKEVKVEIGGFEERTESDKYVYDVTLTEKEVKNDEKKESDDCEKPDDESYDTEADQGFHQDLREGRIYEEEGTEDDYRELDSSRPQSQISKTDSESGRRPQSILSEDQPDSELSELMKQGSSEREDPIERPASPEPEELENKDDTPEFSSEAQASVTELEMEYSGAYSRRDEYASHVSPVREEKYEHEKITEAEAAFSAVPHTIPHMRSSLPEAILENPIAEKHELEEREKEFLRRKITEKPSSPGDIPDITVTQHMTPLLDRNFHYPDLELEAEERKLTQLEETPELVEKDEYEEEKILNEDIQTELPLSKIEKETKIQQKESESLDSPNSDSFEMLDKPDISDEYVIIEEVGREAEEHDQEGKGVQIAAKKRKVTKKGADDEKDELISSPPAPATKLTELKYFPGDEDVGPFPFDSDSPPIATGKQPDRIREKISKDEDDENEYEQQLEESKKWIEMQFQGEQAAKVMGGYGYEIEYERGPLEDIKEEEIGELDSSSKIGSMGSQKESLGSFGSVKDSFSSTPDYDVLAGRKYFTRSGDHDDVSMSSLQEFELLEKKILMENGKKSGSSSSQDSLSSKKLGTSNKSGQGDDLSLASLREFEILENACVTVVKIEHKAKEEEQLLSEIDEGHESQVSESESCETVSGVIKDKPESDSEDFDKRMFEIDEIIKQAQSNVEKFTDLRGLDKTESVGRGDSFEEVAKVPDLELDAPLPGKSLYDSDISLHGAGKTSYSTQIVTKKKVQQWREDELKKSESLEIQSKIMSLSTDSLEVKSDKIMTTSTDSLELEQEKRKKGDMMTDSIEMQGDNMSVDSFDLQLAQKPADTFSIDSFDAQLKSGDRKLTDSMEEDESMKGRGHESSSSGRDGEYSSSGREDSETYSRRAPPRSDYMLGSTDSLDPTSSTATHATYQYETDSVMSSSFTSGGSNTMVSSTDNVDLTLTGKTGLEGIDISSAANRTDIWFENLKVGGEPIVSEIIEPLESDKYSHTIHRTVEMAPEIRKVVFKGPDAESALKEYVEGFAPGEDVIEVQEKDEHGNIHVKRIVKRKIVVRPEDFGGKQPTEDELEAYLRKFEKEGFDSKQEFVTGEFGDDFTSSYPSQSLGQSQTTAYSSDKKLTGKEEGQSSTSKDESGKEASATEKETGISRRPPLVSDISMDDEAEYDTTEHDWRHQLEILHAEADEGEIDEQLDAALASSFSPHK